MVQICSRQTPRTKTKADLRQLENPKTWPILHQGIAGPIQSGRRPPSLPPPSCICCRLLTFCGFTLHLPISWSDEQLAPSPASVTQQPRPASLATVSFCIAATAAGGALTMAQEREIRRSVFIFHSQPTCTYVSPRHEASVQGF